MPNVDMRDSTRDGPPSALSVSARWYLLPLFKNKLVENKSIKVIKIQLLIYR